MTIVAFLACMGAAAAQDWPGWRGAGRDGKLSGFQPPAEWPKELKAGWTVEVGEGHSSAALVDGKLFLFVRQGGSEVALCLDAATGKEVWKEGQAVDFTPENAARTYGKGPFATPTAADGRIYTFGITGLLSCLDAKSGKSVWRYDPKDDHDKPYPLWGTGLSPLVADGLCIVHVGRDKKGTVLAFEAATGKEKWRWEGDGPAYGSPIWAVVGGKPQIILQTEFLTIGLSPGDGKLLWKADFKTPYEQNSVTPLTFGDLVLVSGTTAGVTALRTGGASPEEAWSTKDASLYMSTPILKDGKLFGFSEKGAGQMFCLDAKSGELLWKGDGRQGVNAALLDAGGVFLALLTPAPEKKGAAELVVFDAGDKEYKERARYAVSKGPSFAHPVVSGKSILVRDGTKLVQWLLP
jgi:outer membrane protein assembly factor BamB